MQMLPLLKIWEVNVVRGLEPDFRRRAAQSPTLPQAQTKVRSADKAALQSGKA